MQSNNSPLPTPNAIQIKKFWKKITKLGPDECWPCGGAHQKGGYRKFNFRFNGIIVYMSAHRVSWLIHHGPIPDGFCVLHDCDNPPCCNPHHLFLGTLQDNSDDMVSKGRQACGVKNGKHTHPERTPRGEQHGNARFTDETVLTIRALYASGVKPVIIRKQFSIPTVTFYRIVNREYWTHI